MKIRKFVLIIFVCFLSFLLTGCGNKKAILSSDFKEKLEKKDFEIIDVSYQFSNFDYIKEVTLAENNKGWEMEFYILKNNERAQYLFDVEKKLFESYKTSSNVELSKKANNYQIYSLTTAGYYMYLSQIDDSLLYLRVRDIYKDEVKKVVKSLGY